MVLVKVYGLDQYVVGNYAKEHTSKIADLLEINEEEIMFIAPNNYVFHKGVEQTSWNAVIEVIAEEKMHQLQEVVSKYLISTFKLFSINLHLLFTYYHSHHLVEHFNNEYPRFIKDENIVKIEEEKTEDIDITDEEAVYTGNVFKDFNKKK